MVIFDEFKNGLKLILFFKTQSWRWAGWPWSTIWPVGSGLPCVHPITACRTCSPTTSAPLHWPLPCTSGALCKAGYVPHGQSWHHTCRTTVTCPISISMCLLVAPWLFLDYKMSTLCAKNLFLYNKYLILCNRNLILWNQNLFLCNRY